MASRDGQQFRIWPESFLRPGLRLANSWFYGDMYQALGLVETKSSVEESPGELSLYATEAVSERPQLCGVTPCGSTASCRSTPRWPAANYSRGRPFS